MSALFAKTAVAVALLAITLHYNGLMPNFIPSISNLFPRLGGRPPQTINTAKLLADLNSDISGQANEQSAGLGSTGSDSAGRGEGRKAQLARAASAALSVMYLASLPGLQEQVKQTPGIMASLVRRILDLDLTQAHRDLLPALHQQAQQTAEGPGSHVDLLSTLLLAAARITAGDRALQDWLIGAEGAAHGGKVGGDEVGNRLSEGGLLTRLEEVLHSGVPIWQAAACVLLHTLAAPTAPAPSSGKGGERGPRPLQPPPLMSRWLAQRTESLVTVGKSLVEAGAHFNSSDAVLSGAQLLSLIASQPGGGNKAVTDSRAHYLLGQILLSYAGSNNSSSPMVSGVARLMLYLITGRNVGTEPGAVTRAQPAEQQRQELVKNLTAMGLVVPLVREVRLGQAASLAPSLELLVELISSHDGSNGGASEGVKEAVGAGALSLCSQLLFKVAHVRASGVTSSGSEAHAHSACCHLLHLVRRNCKTRRGSAAGGAAAAVAGAGEGVDSTSHGSSSPKEAEDTTDEGPDEDEGAALCHERTEAGRRAVAATLLRIMRETDLDDLHNAVLEACRDVGPSRPAALALAGAGTIQHLVLLLSHRATTTREEGTTDSAGIAWLLHSQRSAAALIALLALQPDLRERLVAEGALTGLGTFLRNAGRIAVKGSSNGLLVQLRVTAAAALVPLLGDDSRYYRLAVAAGVLEPLLDMAVSDRAQEQQVASRVLRLLARGQEELEELFRSLELDV